MSRCSRWLLSSLLLSCLSLGFPIRACLTQNAPPAPLPETQTLIDQGRQMEKAARYEDALRLYHEALAKARERGDRAGEAVALNGLGIVHHSRSGPRKALEFYEQALPVYREAGLKAGEADALGNIGLAYSDLGQARKALEFYEQALTRHRATGNRKGEARTLNYFGIAYDNLGQSDKALQSYEQALPLYKEFGDKGGVASVLTNIGIAHDLLGQPLRALAYYQEALPMHREVGARRFEANTLASIGDVYKAIGQPGRALEFYERTLPLYAAVGDRRGEALALNGIGNLCKNTGQPQKALNYYARALLLQRDLGDKRGEAGTLTNYGLAYQRLGQPQRALDSYREALPIHREVGNREFEANTLGGMGVVYKDLGQWKQANDAYRQALTLFQEFGNRRMEAQTRNNLGVVAEKQGLLDEAERHYAAAIALLESLRARLGSVPAAQSSFLAAYLEVYHRAIRLWLRRHRPEEAFVLVQKTKARALLDLMNEGKVDLSRRLTDVEREQEQELRWNADRLNAAMIREGVRNEAGAKQRFAALKAQLKQAENELQKFTDNLYARAPELGRKRVARTATLADAARFLPPDTALLEYVTLREADQVALLAVTTVKGRARVRAYSLPATGAALTRQTEAFRHACADPRKPYREQARALYRLLIAPAAKALVGKKRLLVCPDGMLWEMPFAALRSRGRFLAQRYEIAYAYSATGAQAALTTRRARPPGTLLALANPDLGSEKRFGDNPAIPGQRPLSDPSRPLSDPSRPLSDPSRDFFTRNGRRLVALPGVQREAEWLRRRFPGAAVYAGLQAQEATAKTKAGAFRYLHLASHAFFNDAAPMLSSVVLAEPPPGSREDGFLTAREIFDLNLNAEMVVLSACNTARGETRGGEGILGMTWALFVAGAPTQVLSQWSVDDTATATLMQRFYTRLQQGEAKGVALHSATLSLLRAGHPKWRHPYYWAPFILMGDWRR